MPPPPEPLGLGPIILVTKDDKSRVTGDCYARFCGSPGVRLPRATRPNKILGGHARHACTLLGERFRGSFME